MKKRKIWIFALLLVMVLSLAGCEKGSSQTSNNNSDNQSKQEQKEPTQEELNEKLKKEAIKADFVKLNGHAAENKGLKVFAEGKISVVDYERKMDLFPSFMIAQKEGNGFGMYHVANLLDIKDLKDGDSVRIYGSIDGTDQTGITRIVATVIEKVNNTNNKSEQNNAYKNIDTSAYNIGSPERIFAEYIMAWKNNDFSKMSSLCQTSWLKREPKAQEVLEAQYGFKKILGCEIIDINRKAEKATEVTVKVQYTINGKDVIEKKIVGNIIKEDKWGVNPISTLREE